MKTAILTAATAFGLAVVISMGVAALIKGLFTVVRRLNKGK